MADRLWTVVRFPNGSWSYGGKPTDPDYSECEIWQITASSPEAAVKKAQAKRSRDRKRAAAKSTGSKGSGMDKAVLIAGGFVPTTYEGQEGEFLTKKVRVEQMPYASKHLVDDDFIFGTSDAITEVIPGGLVQLHIPDADYVEGPVPVESDEGQALIKDALAAR